MSPVARSNLALLVLRLGLGLIATYYGTQKLFGLFGGIGIHATVESMKSQFGIPPVLAIAAAVAEFGGGIGLVFGFLTNISAFGLASTMAVATYEMWKNPDLAKELFHQGTPATASLAFYSPAIFCGAFAIMMMGAGSYSLDGKIFGKSRKKSKQK